MEHTLNFSKAISDNRAPRRRTTTPRKVGKPRGTSGEFRAVRFRVGNRLQRARLDAGKTQEMVAKHFGLTKQSWGEYERGSMSISLDRLEEFAKYFRVPMEFLISESDEESPPHLDFFDRLKMVCDNLSDEHREMIYRIAETFEAQTVMNKPPSSE